MAKYFDYFGDKKLGRLRTAIFIVIPIFLIYVSVFGNHQKYRHPSIYSPAPAWPSGCPDVNYKNGDDISKSCAINTIDVNLINDYGLATIKRTPYYRVGNDLIEIDCTRSEGHCLVLEVEKNSYHQ